LHSDKLSKDLRLILLWQKKIRNSDCGFDTDYLMSLIKSNSTFVDPIREKGGVPKESFVPSFVYYGVNNQKSLAFRMLGVPRSISNSLSQIISGDLKKYTFTDLRDRVKNLSSDEWEAFRPRNSKLSGKELKRIIDILVK